MCLANLPLNDYCFSACDKVIRILERYYEIELSQIPLRLELIYTKKHLFAFYDGDVITLDPIICSLSECEIGMILAHELAHYFQWKELLNPANRNIFLDYLMEKEAGEAEEDFKTIYCGYSSKERKYKLMKKNWGMIEKFFDSETLFCEKTKYKISAYGIGGVFSINQLLFQKIGAKKGMAVEFKGCHEILTEQAFDICEKKNKFSLNNAYSDKKKLMAGSELNDLYVANDFFRHYLEKTININDAEILNIMESVEKQLEEFNYNTKKYDFKTLDEANSVITLPTSSILFHKSFLNILLQGYLDYILANDFIEEYKKLFKDSIGEMIFKLLPEETFYSIKNFFSDLSEKVGRTFLEGLDGVSDFVGLTKWMKQKTNEVIDWIFETVEYPDGIGKKIDAFVYDFANKSSELCNVFEESISYVEKKCKDSGVIGFAESIWNEIPSNPFQVEICNLDNVTVISGLKEITKKIKGIGTATRRIYCIIQFLLHSHYKGMQFLHSMDCSNGNNDLNIRKCIRFAKFCSFVYWCEKNNTSLLNRKFGDYLTLDLKDENDVLKDMFYPLLIPMTELYDVEYRIKKENVLESNKFDNLRKYIQTAYNGGKKSFFANLTIKEFFTMFADSQKDAGLFALGMACHMIEDSFTASHTIRTWNVNSNISIKTVNDANLVPPILYCANYKKQDGNRHVYSDLFIDDFVLNIDEREHEKHCFDVDSAESKDYNPKLNERRSKDNVNQTVNAAVARDCVSVFLELIFKNCKKTFDELWLPIENFLKVIYTNIEDKSYSKCFSSTCQETQNEVHSIDSHEKFFSAEVFFKLKAGRSYEKDELEEKERKDKLKESVDEFRFAKHHDSKPKNEADNQMSAKINSMRIGFGKSDVVSFFCMRAQWLFNYLELYRSYLINNYASCFYPSTLTFAKSIKYEQNFLKKCCDLAKKNSYRPEFFDLASPINCLKRFRTPRFYPDRKTYNLLNMYEYFDLPYIAKILDISSVLYGESESVKAVLNEEKTSECLDYINYVTDFVAFLDLLKDRHKAHLNEIMATLIWIDHEVVSGCHERIKQLRKWIADLMTV